MRYIGIVAVLSVEEARGGCGAGEASAKERHGTTRKSRTRYMARAVRLTLVLGPWTVDSDMASDVIMKRPY
jgi:hypothetical protein